MQPIVEFKKFTEQQDFFVYIDYIGYNIYDLNPEDYYPLVEEVIENLNKRISIGSLLDITYDLFKDFKQKSLIINMNKKNENYSIVLKEDEIEELSVSKQYARNSEIEYSYQPDGSSSFQIRFNEEKDNNPLTMVNDVYKKLNIIKKKTTK